MPNLEHREPQRHKYICHQCHSEILSKRKHHSKNSSQKQPKLNHQISTDVIKPKNFNPKEIGKNIGNHSDSVGSSRQENTLLDMSRSQSESEQEESEHEFSFDMQIQPGNSPFDPENPQNINSPHDILNSPGGVGQQLAKKKVAQRKRLDLAFLYSDPLVYRYKDTLEPIQSPLDTDIEFREIYKILQHSQKFFTLRREALNFESLKQILLCQPLIIHISCHGDYDEKQQQFYLAFEEKDTGILDKLTEERLSSLLGEENQKVQLVFVSACHSEMIGRIFERAQIPVVVAVNSHTMILDEVCQLFARHFYLHLLDGCTPKQAFTEAQRVVKGSPIEKFACCCSHDHKPGCRWVAYAQSNGYEKAHNLHMPNCQCPQNQNLHKNSCKFYNNFETELQPYEDLTNLTDVQGFSDWVKVCCCQPELPHDESIKFILCGKEEAKNKQLFHSRKEGNLVVEQDVNHLNKLPHIIDTLMLIGRNIELQKLVSLLFSEMGNHRLIHIYGVEGLGKSTLANYAAKYTLDRRKFTDGVYYIDLQNRNSAQGLISKICQKLLISNCDKEQLCAIIKTSRILIILDKCQKMIEQSLDQFNRTLKFIIETTMYAKLIVITYECNDIDRKQIEYQISQIQIKELDKYQAAELLMIAAKGCKYLKQFKSSQELANHKLFKLNVYKPQGILQIASLLFEKSLDEIMADRERDLAKQEEEKKDEHKENLEYGNYSWIMSIKHNRLETSFKLEIKVLYLLCQFPAGLFYGDIDIICDQQQQQYGNWKKFLETISQDGQGLVSDKQSSQLKSIIARTQQMSMNQSSIRMIISNYSDELQENHYIPQPIVAEYINKLVLSQKKQLLIFTQSFMYLTKLSRRILRSIKNQRKFDIDLCSVSSEIDLGIWKDNITNIPISEAELEISIVQNPIVKFNFYESNFIGFLDIDALKQHYPKMDYTSNFIQFIDELCANIPSIFMMLGRFEEARICLEKIKKISDYYSDFKLIKAKGDLILSSIKIRQHHTYYEVSSHLDQAQKILFDLRYFDGVGDAFFLQAIALINSINTRLHLYDEEEGHLENSYFAQTTPHHITRANSEQLDNEKMFHQVQQRMNSFQIQHQQSITINQIPQQRQLSYSSMKSEIEGVLNNLMKARKYYQDADLDYGVAKTFLVQAEFLIDKGYGSGLQVDFNPQQITGFLIEAMKLFKKYNNECFEIRCLRNLALLKYRNKECLDAKKYIEDAIALAKRVQDKHQEGLCCEIQNQILDQIRIESNNVFIFAKAFQLVELENQNIRVVGTFTRYPSDFRMRLIKKIKKTNKVVNVKFDILNRELLDYVRQHGCRVLHLSSDVYLQDYLCIEGKNGEIEYISIDELKNILKPPHSGRVNVDVVVLAIPESKRLADAFVEMGVPHVIGFDFKHKLLSTFLDNVYTVPKRYDYIYDFCVEFYKNLIQEKTVEQACKNSKPRLNDGIRKVGDIVENFSLTQHNVGQGPVLLPEDKKHSQRLFDSNSPDDKKQLKTGKCIDTSRVRGPTNLKKYSKPFTGRQIETYKMITYLQKPNIKLINVIGLEGIGKTRFVAETAYYVYTRYMFQDGIFIIDLRRVKTAEQIKSKLKELNIGGGQSQDLNAHFCKKNILLILDNIDTILKHNKTQFDWFLISIMTSSEHLKVIVTSRKEIKPKDYQCLERSIAFCKMRPLNDIEAVDMILSNCTRQITHEELQMSSDSRISIHHQMQQEKSIKRCYGFPKYLEFFSSYLSQHSFDKIDIKNYIPQQNKSQMEWLVKEQKTYGESQFERLDSRDRNQESQKRKQGSHQKKRRDLDFDQIIQEDWERVQKSSLYIQPSRSNEIIENDTIPEVEEELVGSQCNQSHPHSFHRDSRDDSKVQKVSDYQRADRNKKNLKGTKKEEKKSEQQSDRVDDDDRFFKYTQRIKGPVSTIEDIANVSPCLVKIGKSILNLQQKLLQESEDAPSITKSSHLRIEEANLDGLISISNIMFQEIINKLPQSEIDEQLINLFIPVRERGYSESTQFIDPPETRSRSGSIQQNESLKKQDTFASMTSLQQSKNEKVGKFDQVLLDNNDLAHSEMVEEEDERNIESSFQSHLDLTNTRMHKDELEQKAGDAESQVEYEDEEDKEGIYIGEDQLENSLDNDDIDVNLRDLCGENFTMNKKTSVFTLSSGKRSDSITSGILSSQNLSRIKRYGSRKQDQVMKDKKKARELQGARSGRQGKKFKTQIKNKYQEQIQQNLIQRKLKKKEQDIAKKHGYTQKISSSNNLLEGVSEDEMESKVVSKEAVNPQQEQSKELPQAPLQQKSIKKRKTLQSQKESFEDEQTQIQ